MGYSFFGRVSEQIPRSGLIKRQLFGLPRLLGLPDFSTGIYATKALADSGPGEWLAGGRYLADAHRRLFPDYPEPSTHDSACSLCESG